MMNRIVLSLIGLSLSWNIIQTAAAANAGISSQHKSVTQGQRTPHTRPFHPQKWDDESDLGSSSTNHSPLDSNQMPEGSNGPIPMIQTPVLVSAPWPTGASPWPWPMAPSPLSQSLPYSAPVQIPYPMPPQMPPSAVLVQMPAPITMPPSMPAPTTVLLQMPQPTQGAWLQAPNPHTADVFSSQEVNPHHRPHPAHNGPTSTEKEHGARPRPKPTMIAFENERPELGKKPVTDMEPLPKSSENDSTPNKVIGIEEEEGITSMGVNAPGLGKTNVGKSKPGKAGAGKPSVGKPTHGIPGLAKPDIEKQVPSKAEGDDSEGGQTEVGKAGTGKPGVGCGVQAPQLEPKFNSAINTVTNAEDAQPNSWPWVVAFVVQTKDKKGVRICNAYLLRTSESLEESDILLTAAHCVTSDESLKSENPKPADLSLYIAAAGKHRNYENEKYEQIVKVVDVRFYFKWLEGHGSGDIALVKLATPIKFNKGIRPICLPTQQTVPTTAPSVQQMCVVVGWGRDRTRIGNKHLVIRQMITTTLPADVCVKSYPNNFKTISMMCVDNLSGTSGTCASDVGAMVACQENGAWVLHGIVNNASLNSCAESHKPSLFARASFYRDWIEKTTKELSTAELGGQTLTPPPTEPSTSESASSNPEPQLASTPPPIVTVGCGLQAPQYMPMQTNPVGQPQSTRLFNGVEARPHSWPWLVTLMVLLPNNKGVQLCGANLVRASDDQEESDVVVTAAQCVGLEDVSNLDSKITPPSLDSFTALIGHHRYDMKQGEVVRNISEIRVHPAWGPSHGIGDVAVLKLAQPVKFSNTIRPICLPKESDDFTAKGTCVIAGWNRDKTDDVNASPAALQQLVVTVRAPGECKSTFPDKYKQKFMICAGPSDQKSGTCVGDTGGMLACQDERGGWVLEGVINFRNNSCATMQPGMFSRVSHFSSWIEKTIKEISFLSGGPNKH